MTFSLEEDMFGKFISAAGDVSVSKDILLADFTVNVGGECIIKSSNLVCNLQSKAELGLKDDVSDYGISNDISTISLTELKIETTLPIEDLKNANFENIDINASTSLFGFTSDGYEVKAQDKLYNEWQSMSSEQKAFTIKNGGGPNTKQWSDSLEYKIKQMKNDEKTTTDSTSDTAADNDNNSNSSENSNDNQSNENHQNGTSNNTTNTNEPNPKVNNNVSENKNTNINNQNNNTNQVNVDDKESNNNADAQSDNQENYTSKNKEQIDNDEVNSSDNTDSQSDNQSNDNHKNNDNKSDELEKKEENSLDLARIYHVIGGEISSIIKSKNDMSNAEEIALDVTIDVLVESIENMNFENIGADTISSTTNVLSSFVIASYFEKNDTASEMIGSDGTFGGDVLDSYVNTYAVQVVSSGGSNFASVNIYNVIGSLAGNYGAREVSGIQSNTEEEAILSSVGGAIGGTVGAAFGSFLGPLGTMAGAAIGTWIGTATGDSYGEALIDAEDSFKKMDDDLEGFLKGGFELLKSFTFDVNIDTIAALLGMD